MRLERVCTYSTTYAVRVVLLLRVQVLVLYYIQDAAAVVVASMVSSVPDEHTQGFYIQSGSTYPPRLDRVASKIDGTKTHSPVARRSFYDTRTIIRVEYDSYERLNVITKDTKNNSRLIRSNRDKSKQHTQAGNSNLNSIVSTRTTHAAGQVQDRAAASFDPIAEDTQQHPQLTQRQEDRITIGRSDAA